MIKQHYTGASRRAMNLIWNAAQDYDWNCPFLAFHPNGTPDDYLNMVIGLSAKWLDRERITDFFERLGTGPTIDEASSLLWLGIESCVYGKELPSRPVLEEMRRQRALEFFRISGMLSEQQMSFMSIRVYDQELIRWSHVLGRRVLAVTPGAVRLSEKLEFSPEWDSDQVLGRMHEILRDDFHRTLSRTTAGEAAAGSGILGKIAGVFARNSHKSADLLTLRKGSGRGDAKRSVHIFHEFDHRLGSVDSAADQAYMEMAFGKCMYSETEMGILEKALCRDNDSGCRLWFSSWEEKAKGAGKKTETKDPKMEAEAKDAGKGAEAKDPGKGTETRDPGKGTEAKDTGRDRSFGRTKEATRLRRDQETQWKRNEEFYRAHVFQISESIRNLSAQTQILFESWLSYLPARAKSGKLEAERAWRPGAVSDMKIFLADSEPDDASVCVDLLLDASQSRMNAQEMIASQAYVIARSLEEGHVPVRVTAFRSLRAYTILQTLKDFGERGGEGIFRYYAGGWNRDALCLKAMQYLMAEEKRAGTFRTRILMVLTDASPNDSIPLPPKEGSLFPREYEGDEPVRDAQEAVRRLRSDGVLTCALFYGATAHLDEVHQIYGNQYVRVKTLTQLPGAVCELLGRCLARTNRYTG